jgi:GT2 family glycosyltransferase
MEQSFKDFEIIFVDNNSSDGSVEFIKENYSSDKIKIFVSEQNLGFAGGNNFGFNHCKGDFIVLLNNDTVADKDWLRELVACVTSNENIGIAQSLVLTDGIPSRYYEMNGTVNLLGHNVMEVFDIDRNGIGEIFLASGCSLIIKRTLAEELNGLFLDEYFAYSEDTFLCFKVKFRGLKIIHTSLSKVDHRGGGTSENKKASILYFYQERNRLLNFLLLFSAGFIVKYIPYMIFNFFMKLTASLLSRKYSVLQLIKVYGWLLLNLKWISEQRSLLNKIKLENEDYVLGYLSGKIFNGENIFEKIVNSFSVFYCKLTGIKIMENK